MRYPVLWERTVRPGSPSSDPEYDWSWADERLGRLRQLGVEPIVGLLHHGSGPVWTDLLDDAFAPGLARFAAGVAQRYPWVTRYTVVNEPLTTARFSALYGHWYPHRRDDDAFIRALVNQCRAVVLAMQAIRAVNPNAQLVQTEDMCKVFSTAALAEKAAFYNDRRWLTFDLLCGRVNEKHPLWAYLRHASGEAGLQFFLEHPAPPDVIGLNYYLTSDRFLDDRTERYPGLAAHPDPVPFVDIEAVRVEGCGPVGHAQHIRDIWDRYGLPIAITEVHLGCSREEQLRWLREAWDAGCAARAEGIPLIAVTPWALMGSMDWDSLLVCDRQRYEAGAFDVRNGARPTAIAGAVRELASGREIAHPAARGFGWWHQPSAHGTRQSTSTRPPLLITGATGTLGRAMARICERRGLAYRLVSRSEMDIANPEEVARVVKALRPWAIVNASGYVRVDDAEYEVERCWRENVRGPEVLAQAAAQSKLPFVTFSSDLVFDGETDAPYTERAQVAPLSVYGRSKAAAEQIVIDIYPQSLIVRTAAFFGPWDPYNAVTMAMQTLSAGEVTHPSGDSVVSPTYVPDLVSACLDLLIDGEHGIWHLANDGAVTWAELEQAAAVEMGLNVDLIQPCRTDELALVAPRPRYSALGSERCQLMPPLDSAVARYVRELETSAF